MTTEDYLDKGNVNTSRKLEAGDETKNKMKIKNNKKSIIIVDIKKKGKNSNKDEKEEYNKESKNEI